jgi:methylated-DNA-[protein]-cysteine S-methyltransferase
MPETAQQPSTYTLFETNIGWIGIAWSEAGLTRLQLPERSEAATERRLLAAIASDSGPAPQRAAGDPPTAIVALIEALLRYAAGEPVDFSDVPVDLAGVDPFRRAIYDAAQKLGFGDTTTYGGLAAAAGHPGLARETGQALGRNPVPIVIPCHRIVAAGNKLGGFSAPGGSATKERLLAMEGVRVGPPPPAQASFGF